MMAALDDYFHRGDNHPKNSMSPYKWQPFNKPIVNIKNIKDKENYHPLENQKWGYNFYKD